MATESVIAAGLVNATPLQLQDFIDDRMRKAHALANATYGEQGESFRHLNDEIQDSFMWALAGTLDEALAASDELAKRGAQARIGTLHAAEGC